MTQTAQIEVYTDGQCQLCRWTREHVEPLDREHRIEWLDYNEAEVLKRAAPRTWHEMAAEMHTRTPEGRWARGYEAWLEVLSVLPRWRWLVPVLSAWPFARLGPVLYRWIAARRYTLFGVPPPCDPNGVCSLHAPKKEQTKG